MWEEIAVLEKENPELVNDCFKTINFERVYYNFLKPKRI